MYEAFYGLEDKPFSLAPDPDYLYLSRKHQVALSLLRYGLSVQAGFTVITGEVGSGKTTLIRRLLQEISHDISVGLITNTHSAFGDILEWVLLAFNLDYRDKSKVERYDAFVNFLVDQYAVGRRTVLIVDEAQNMDIATLEELRLLSNINADKDQVLEIILVGQPELLEKLQRPELRQFCQRITVDYHLTSLDRIETQEYVEHRIRVAGGELTIFKENVYDLIHHYTDGVPRLINNLCDMALVYGFAEEKQPIDAETILSVVADRRLGGLKTLSDDKGEPSQRQETSKKTPPPGPKSRRPNPEQDLKPSSSVVIDLEDPAIVEPTVRRRSGRPQPETQAGPGFDDGSDKPTAPVRMKGAASSTGPANQKRMAVANPKARPASVPKEPAKTGNGPRRPNNLKSFQQENRLNSGIRLVNPVSNSVKPIENPVAPADRSRLNSRAQQAIQLDVIQGPQRELADRTPRLERNQTDTLSQGAMSEPTQITSGRSTVLANSGGPVSELNKTSDTRTGGNDKSGAGELAVAKQRNKTRYRLYSFLTFLLFMVVGLVLLLAPNPLNMEFFSENHSDLNQPTQTREPLRRQEPETQTFRSVPGVREKFGDGLGSAEEPDDRVPPDQTFLSQERASDFRDRLIEIPDRILDGSGQVGLPLNPKPSADKTNLIRLRESEDGTLDLRPLIGDPSESAVPAGDPSARQTAEQHPQDITEAMATGELKPRQTVSNSFAGPEPDRKSRVVELPVAGRQRSVGKPSQIDRLKSRDRNLPAFSTGNLMSVDPKSKVGQLPDSDTPDPTSNTVVEGSTQDSELDSRSLDGMQNFSVEGELKRKKLGWVTQRPKHTTPLSEQPYYPKSGVSLVPDGVDAKATEDLEQGPDKATVNSLMEPEAKRRGSQRTSNRTLEHESTETARLDSSVPDTIKPGIRPIEDEEGFYETAIRALQPSRLKPEVVVVTPDQPYISEWLHSGDQAKLLASLMIGEKQSLPLAKDARTQYAHMVRDKGMEFARTLPKPLETSDDSKVQATSAGLIEKPGPLGSDDVVAEEIEPHLVDGLNGSQANPSDRLQELALSTSVDASVALSTPAREAWQSSLHFLIWDRLKKVGLGQLNQQKVPSEDEFSAAVRKFQMHNGLWIDGQATLALLVVLDQRLLAIYGKRRAKTVAKHTSNKDILAINHGLAYELPERSGATQLNLQSTKSSNDPSLSTRLLENSVHLNQGGVYEIWTTPLVSNTVAIEDMVFLVTEIQVLLKIAGFNPGRVDGIPGIRTRSAIRSYQESMALGTDGKPSKDLLNRLQKQLKIPGR